jgi:hypothetical protein
LRNFTGVNTTASANINDSAISCSVRHALPKALQLYFGASLDILVSTAISGKCAARDWYVMKDARHPLNGELMYRNRSPVGYTAYPYPVGAKGPVFHFNLELNF